MQITNITTSMESYHGKIFKNIPTAFWWIEIEWIQAYKPIWKYFFPWGLDSSQFPS